MRIEVTQQLPDNLEALVLMAFEAPELVGSAVEQDPSITNYLRHVHSSGELDCKKCKVTVLHSPAGVRPSLIVVVGGGSSTQLAAGDAYRCAAAAAKALAKRARCSVAFDFGVLSSDVARAAVCGAINGCQGQDILRSQAVLQPIQQILWMRVQQADAHWGAEVGESMLLARHLVNLPPNLLYPESFVQRAAEVAVAEGLECDVWDELRLRRENCGALLAVARGSLRPPRLLTLRYPGRKSAPPLVLVGKGVTFDSGGLSLKHSENMLTMKCDMAGAATVLAAMQAISRLKLDTPVVGMMGLVENMISGASYRLGDVLTSRNGKTIEVHNTDAEGRLVLADVLDVAVAQEPCGIIDVATLTGACVVALGTDVTGLMTNDSEWQAQFLTAAQRAGELVWPLPMSEHFAEQVRGAVADLKNVGDGRWGGAITAAKFLQEFVGDVPWIHADIAGPAFFDTPKAYQDAGGTGVLVRSLVSLAERL
ncbi:MAG: leucyl aminopeptidase [Pirellulaceae bacterium]|nr:leucyl aminopeptidase [Pirellulaceae bacterium]